MGVRVFKSLFLIPLLLLEATLGSFCFADEPIGIPSPQPCPQQPVDYLTEKVKDDPSSLFYFKKRQGADVDTILLINAQDQRLGNTNFKTQDNISAGQDRAKQMMQLLQNEEMQKILPRMTDKGKDMLRENPELKTPGAIIAGTVSLWAGRTIRFFKGDYFQVSSYIEAKSHTGDFKMESPLLNGKLQFNDTDGLQLNVNRSISSIQTNASVVYTARNQSVGGQVSRPLVPHLNLNLGTSQSTLTNQVDQRAWIDFHLNF